ncbi:MAG: serine/threonine-protein kinase [Acidobacteriota bacterium]
MIGSVIGNYRILEKLGEGGMGTVYRGIDMMLEREVAIKALRAELTSNPELAERFRAEAVTLAKLNHPNIATLHTFFRQGNEFFMVMEFVRGETLDNFLRRAGAMETERAVTLFCQALEGIGHAHSLGIIHRDIKPANMMLTMNGSIKVMDFGIARVLGTSRMTRQGNIVGTIEYMSPEAIQGYDVDARSDIYSLGMLLFEMLTGRLPFVADSEFKMMMAQIQQAPPPPRTFAPHIPLSIEQAIMRSLAKNPDARFQGVVEFRQALEKGLRGSTAATAIAPPAMPPTRMGAPPAFEGAMNPTRMAADPQAMAPTVAIPANQQWPGQIATPPSSYPHYPQPQYQQTPPFGQLVPASSGFNWKPFAIVAFVIVLLGAGAFAVMNFMKKDPPKPPAIEKTVVPEPSPPAPPSSNQPAVQPLPGGGTSETAVAPPPETVDEKEAGKKPSGRRSETAAREAAARERARRRQEARRLLDQ